MTDSGSWLMRKFVLVSAVTLLAFVGNGSGAEARHATYDRGIIGGMSANEILARSGHPYYGYPAYPSHGVGFYAGSPARVYVAPGYPPPGCVIRAQRVWTGFAWRSRKIRVCY